MCGTKFSRRRSLTFTPEEQSSSSYLPNETIKQEQLYEGLGMQNAFQPMLCSSDNTVHSSQERKTNSFKNGVLTPKNNIRHTVTHNYHDHAYDLPAQSGSRKTKGGVAVPFPIKLHQMLDEIENKGLGYIVSWQPHGRAFVVHKPKEFVETILPAYFKQTKLGSFQRQLNLYGFTRITSGKDKGGYYHELFLRNKPFLTDRMIRKKVKGTGVRGSSNPEAEPNFYEMTPIGGHKVNDDFEAYEEALLSSFEEKDKIGSDLAEFEGHFFHMIDIPSRVRNDQAMKSNPKCISSSESSSAEDDDSTQCDASLEDEMIDFIKNLEVPGFNDAITSDFIDDDELGSYLEKIAQV